MRQNPLGLHVQWELKNTVILQTDANYRQNTVNNITQKTRIADNIIVTDAFPVVF